jgi:hypothetical protein
VVLDLYNALDAIACMILTILTVIDHQPLHIAHDLCIAEVGVGGDGFQAFAMFQVDCGGLGMKDKGDGQQALEGVSVGQHIVSERLHTLIHSICNLLGSKIH